jgi:hypothetical protein
VRLAHPRSALLVCASAFVALACAALLMGVLPADATVYRALASIGSPAVRRVMHVVNYAGAWQVLLPGTLLLYAVFERARERWWIWLVLMVAAPLAEQLMKFSIARHRPEDPSYGFPSGHATASAAFFGAVIYLAGSLPPRRRRLVRARRSCSSASRASCCARTGPPTSRVASRSASLSPRAPRCSRPRRSPSAIPRRRLLLERRDQGAM